MGRMYMGNIDGQFWFGVQSSYDASFFGGEQYEPNYIDFCFSKKDLKDIKKGVKECKKELGTYKKKLDTFFKEIDAYGNEMIEKKFKITSKKTKSILKWYARLELGEKILKCVEKTGECNFEAEL